MNLTSVEPNMLKYFLRHLALLNWIEKGAAREGRP
jgi:hypothetical protein